MRKPQVIIFAVIILFVFVNNITVLCKETVSPETAYGQIQMCVENKDWGALYDSYDLISRGLIDILSAFPLASWFQFGDGGPPSGFDKLSGRDKYIRVLGKNEMNLFTGAERKGYRDTIILPGYVISSEYKIINIDKGQNAAEISIKDNTGDLQKIYMHLENGEWKLHINENSTQYKIARAVESGDYAKVGELIPRASNDHKVLDEQIDKDVESKFAASGNNKEEQLFAAITLFSDSRDLRFEFDERKTIEKVEQIITSLLSEGADINAKKEEFGRVYPFLLYAVDRSKNIEIVEFLISKGANVNAADSDGKTALHLAASRGDKKLVELLIGKGADVNAKDKYGWTALMNIAKAYINSSHKEDYQEIIDLLISKGANIDDVDKYGNTALIWAAMEKNKDIVEFLVLKGADMNIKNSHGDTALWWATVYNNKDIVEFLSRYKH